MSDYGDQERAGNELISIGQFALLSELSIPQLRRYHQQGLMVPADVDDATGYRRYRLDQLDQARTIARLRRVDVPLAELATLADTMGRGRGNDRRSRLAVLEEHRRRLTARLADTQRMVEVVDQLIAEERESMTVTGVQLIELVLHVEDVDAAVAFYRDAFGFEFQPDDHRGTMAVHYDACGGAWDPDGFFMFTIFPAAADHATKAWFGLFVDDLDAAFALAVKAGATVVREPWDSGYMPRSARVADPAGNTVNLYRRAAT